MNALPKKDCPKAVTAAKGHDNQSRQSPILSPQAYPESKQPRKRIAIWFDMPVGRRRLVGQTARAMAALLEAGSNGVTALEMSSWALRLGAYVHLLRRDYSLEIVTMHETHNELGDWHGRYVLLSRVRILEAANVG
jgi:hypothetical protein